MHDDRICNKMKKKNSRNSRKIYTPNTHTHDHPQIYTPNTHTHDRQLSWLGTDTYLKSGGVKLSNHRYILQNKC